MRESVMPRFYICKVIRSNLLWSLLRLSLGKLPFSWCPSLSWLGGALTDRLLLKHSSHRTSCHSYARVPGLLRTQDGSELWGSQRHGGADFAFFVIFVLCGSIWTFEHLNSASNGRLGLLFLETGAYAHGSRKHLARLASCFDLTIHFQWFPSLTSVLISFNFDIFDVPVPLKRFTAYLISKCWEVMTLSVIVVLSMVVDGQHGTWPIPMTWKADGLGIGISRSDNQTSFLPETKRYNKY